MGVRGVAPLCCVYRVVVKGERVLLPPHGIVAQRLLFLCPSRLSTAAVAMHA